MSSYTETFIALSHAIEDINTIPERLKQGINVVYVNGPTDTLVVAYRCTRHNKNHFHMLVQVGPQEGMMITRVDVGELLSVLPLTLEDFRYMSDTEVDTWGELMELEEHGTRGVHYHGIGTPPFSGMRIDFGNMGDIVSSILRHLSN